MKKALSKKHSVEDMKKFIYSFAEALSPGGKPVFYVNTTRCKNRFFFRVKTKDNWLYGLSYTKWHDDIGTFGKIDSLFKEANPKIMLCPQMISIEELVHEFNIDLNRLIEAIFKKIKTAISYGIRCHSDISNKMHFIVELDSFASKNYNGKNYNAYNAEIPVHLESTPDVSSIEELMVWADLNAGVS